MPRYRLARRQVLTSLGAAPILSILSPRAQAIAPPRDTAEVPGVESEWILDITLHLRLATPATAAQGRAIILGGKATGPLLRGAVLPGSLEWSLDAERGVLRLAAHYDLEADSGLRIHVADRAAVAVSAAGCWNVPFTTTPDLELISGPAVHRNALYLGRMDASDIDAGKLRLNVHRVL
jgi:hypothetical protein